MDARAAPDLPLEGHRVATAIKLDGFPLFLSRRDPAEGDGPGVGRCRCSVVRGASYGYPNTVKSVPSLAGLEE
jgi:hypothetical protein